MKISFFSFALLLSSLPLAEAQKDTDRSALQLTLPPAIYAVPGVETSIYFDNIIVTQTPETFRFQVSAKVGTTEERRWVFTPGDSDVGRHSITISVIDQAGKTVDSQSTELHVIPKAAGADSSIKLLIVGDSLTHASAYPNEIARSLTQPGNPRWKMLGTHAPARATDRVAHEGYGGWTWERFATKHEPNPDGTYRKRSSPFVFLNDQNTPELNVARYFDEHCDGERPDYTIILLGINDCFSAPADDVAGIDARIDSMFKHADRLLAAIQKAAPQTHVGFCLTPAANSRQAAFEANYKDRYTRWGWKRIQHQLVQRQLEYVKEKNDSRLSVIPTELNIDPVDGYPDNNAVHPNDSGYAQIGQTIYSWLKWRLQEHNSDEAASANGHPQHEWEYSTAALKPFWQADVVSRESVLFLRDSKTAEARGSLLFPVEKVISVQNAAGTVTYQRGTDYEFETGSREITIPVNSNVVTKTPAELRRPAGSQKYRLTHRDGGDEILFGPKLEYHEMQTWVTYTKATSDWPVEMPDFDAGRLPRTIGLLRNSKPVSIVLLGDSISTGCNASRWGEGAPFQPAYQDLLREHLARHCRTDVKLTNLSVGGKSTPWGIDQIDHVVDAQPDLVIIAFGMNDAARRSAEEYARNTQQMINKTRQSLPNAEFILIATMLGNRNWTTLKHEVFPQYRNELAKLTGPGIALADMTSVWNEFLKRKKDADLTGNGVNHPNDFGHRVYAQVLSAILVDDRVKN